MLCEDILFIKGSVKKKLDLSILAPSVKGET